MIYLFSPAYMDNIGTPSTNLGDFMIQEAVVRELRNIFPNQEFRIFSSHSAIPMKEIKIRKNDLCFVGGSNLLSSEMNLYAQWKITLFDAFRLRNIILFGVGWWQYQKKPNDYTRLLYSLGLSAKLFHSVRDSHTSKMLKDVGIRNSVVTGCPTMWPLINKDQGLIPRNKSNNALVMLTDYNKSTEVDKSILDLISTCYDNIYFWPQGSRDLEYLADLELKFPIIILERSIEALDQFINSDIQFDYIGTRLHGGIRCLINNKRSLILEVDNRAREISRDTGLPSVARTNIDYIRNWIETAISTNINLNETVVSAWKNQFINFNQ